MLRLPGRGIGGRPVPWPPREQRIVPPSRGGRARRAAAEYQPGYDGLPGGAQGLRAPRVEYDQDYDCDQDFVVFDEATKATSNSRKSTTLSRS